MNTSPSSGTPFELTREQMNQQVDLALRLMHMAMAGAPTPADGSPLTSDRLALHALMTALGSLAAANPALTDRAAKGLVDLADALKTNKAIKYLTDREQHGGLDATH